MWRSSKFGIFCKFRYGFYRRSAWISSSSLFATSHSSLGEEKKWGMSRLYPAIYKLVTCHLQACNLPSTSLYPATYKLVSCHLQACILPPTSLYPAIYKLVSYHLQACILPTTSLYPTIYKLVSCPLQACILPTTSLYPAYYKLVSCVLQAGGSQPQTKKFKKSKILLHDKTGCTKVFSPIGAFLHGILEFWHHLGLRGYVGLAAGLTITSTTIYIYGKSKIRAAIKIPSRPKHPLN